MSGEPERHTGWPRAAASVVVLRDRHVLLVQRGKGALAGYWSFPGGHIEPGESAAAAAKREVLEETGVEVRIDDVVEVHDVILRDHDGHLTTHYVISVFCGCWVAGEPRAASDVRQALFVDLNEVGSRRLTEGVERIIAKAARLAQI